jgi:hypothetical protein
VQFQNPALLAGALLFAVPLIIHLLNRQRHKKRPWAAMEFLLRAWQKQKNRLRNENLLLLLLRCLVPIVLAFAIARPLFEKAAGLLAGSTIVHHVVVVDGSYSMGLRVDGATSSFERARTLVGKLLDRCEQNAGGKDRLTLVLAGVRPRFLCRSVLDLAAARNQWLLLQKPEDGAGDLAPALQQVAQELEAGDDPDVQVYVVTDQQAQALGKLPGPAATTAVPADGAPAVPPPADADRETPPRDGLTNQDTVRDVVESLQKRPGTRLHWIDVGPFVGRGGIADNAQVTGLRIEQPAAVLRTAIDVVATVKNRGQVGRDLEVTLDVDGSEPLRKIVPVPAGGEAEADFQLSFREVGRRRLRASIAGDGLVADDERFATIEVRDRIRVLVVDGEAGGDPLRSYRYLWQSILDPDSATLPMFAVETAEPLQLLAGQCTPKNHDVVVLADVDRLNDTAADALLGALAAGRGLLITAGERAQIDSYNLHLHRAGDGPLPFRLRAMEGGKPGEVAPRAPVLLKPEHPLFAEFEEEIYREVFQAVPVWRWQAVADDSRAADSEVLATLNDGAAAPLLAVRAVGDGKAVFLASPIASEQKADRWNRLDDPMIAFPLLHGLVKWLALPATDPFHRDVGGELTTTVPARPENIEVQRPERDGRPKAPLAEEPLALPRGRYQLPPLSDTPFAGFYQFELVMDRDAGKEALVLPFAVNVAADEGELRFLAPDEAKQVLGLERVLDGLPAIATQSEDHARSELGPTLLLLTLLFVLGEAALARFVSVRRS